MVLSVNDSARTLPRPLPLPLPCEPRLPRPPLFLIAMLTIQWFDHWPLQLDFLFVDLLYVQNMSVLACHVML